MIANSIKKILIITPFKCGSSTLSQLSGTPYTYMLYGPANLYNIESFTVHSPFVPIEFYGYRRIIICRDPYERASSMYFQHTRWTKKNNLPEIDIDTYIDEKLLRMDPNAPMLLPISKLYQASNWEEFWRLEELDERILETFGITIGRQNVSPNTITLNNEQKRRLRPWAEQDCENFNYEVF